MNLEELKAVVAVAVARLTGAEWEKVAGEFTEVEKHDTGMSGRIRLMKKAGLFLVVEEPQPDVLAVRKVASAAAGRDFLRERMAAYDRMWDG